MKRLLLLITLLVLSSGPSYAEWVPIDVNDRGMTTYVDPDTIRRKRDLVKIWHMFDGMIVDTIRGVSFLSFKAQGEYDCAEELRRELSVSYHSGNMGGGKTVYIASDVGKWVPVAPGTLARALWAFACDKK